MKLRIILFGMALLIGLTTISNLVLSQSCTPDVSITTPGFYPAELPIALVGEKYNASLQVLALQDTNVVFQSIPVLAQIDSIVLEDILGLPSGFSYACVPNGCSFSYPDVGCVGLEGKATSDQIGDHPLKIAIRVYAKISGFAVPQEDTLTIFTLYVRETGSTGITQVRSKGKVSIYPNPLDNNVLNISGTFIPTSATIVDPKGQIAKKHINTNGFNSLNINDLKAGVYSLLLENGKERSVQKLIVLTYIN